ncbi:hypothetical protein [Pollutimonas thiosulfatoxidans]|uniref:Uncharacterized protein n=1 Tax=Pollutimonas thiosulfatoxidans TaxID=2028345 RepID=A0A410GDL4_9BURK|nr:hypothetical protein [Pollutimonas thiosulfatoxidans]MBF6617506.1 hypothetical protein [Candidimonas sp.]NYT44112.1 hypothetical protein [Alcaligenaceae bacterium]QAA94359.1 hypothetical protein CKA81_11340 [Pollutimonas thiosulfatoxidans]
MSDLSINQYTRLNDSLERDLMRQALNSGESLSFTALTKNALGSLRKAGSWFFAYMIDVTEALNEARAKDSRYSRSYW